MIVSGQLEKAGLENLGSLPVSDLFEGRVVNVLGTIYLYSTGQWLAQAAGSQSLPAMNPGTAGLILSNNGFVPVWQEQYPDDTGFPNGILRTDGGGTEFWDNQYPDDTGQAGEFLQTDGAGNVSWAVPPGSIPNVSGNSGKYLYTDGVIATWEFLLRARVAAGTASHVLINDGSGLMSSEAQLAQTRGGFGADVSAFTGLVKSVAGVFSASALVDADVSASANINATKLGTGAVNNTQFNYLLRFGRFASTSKITGGTLSINADPTKFDLSLGTGAVIDYSVTPATPTITDVSWSAFTAQTVTNLATADITYVLMNNAGAIVQQTTYPTPSQQRDNIFIGRLSHASRTSIAFIDNIGNNDQSPGNQLQDFMDAIGPFNIQGNTPATNGANLTFQKSSGSMFSRYYQQVTTPTNPHVVSIASAAPVTFAYRTQLGGVTGNVTNTDPTMYDVGGVVTAVPGAGATSTIQRIFLFPSGNIRIQYGQTTYSSLANAIAAIATDPFVIANSIAGFSILIGYIVVQKNCTDLSAVTARIIPAARFDTGSGGGSISTTTLQQAYANSVQPQITLTSGGGGIQFRDASAALGTPLFAIQSNSGATTFMDVGVIGIRGNNFPTASRALVTDSSSAIGQSTTTATEIGYVSGVTSAIQTQLNGKALLSGTLAQFAATTSAQLLGVISDETGTGSLVFGTSPTLATPVINGNPTGTFIVAIANGGHGQATKADGFDALSPTTTKGDLIAHDGSDNIRRAVGADGTVLTADSSQASGLNWTSPLTNPMTTLGDIIYENASPAATRLPGNTTVQPQFLRQIGTGAISAVPAWANLLTSNVSGLNAAQATAHTLTFLSPQDIYITSPASAINQDLPTTSVLAGQIWRLIVSGATSTNTVTLRSSGGNNIDVIGGTGFILVQALQNTPTTAAHWKIIDVYEEFSYTSTFTFSGGGPTTAAATIKALRRGNMVTLRVGTATVATTGFTPTGLNSNTDLPARFGPTADRNYPCWIYNAGALLTTPGAIVIQTNGNINVNRDILSTAWSNSGSICGLLESEICYDTL